jgi:LDH2 family malate/lactate/ureidoglycolate dehydrogenase
MPDLPVRFVQCPGVRKHRKAAKNKGGIPIPDKTAYFVQSLLNEVKHPSLFV